MLSFGSDELTTERLRLEPLSPAHAAEMAPLLDDPALHTYVGGSPLSVEELHEQYARQSRGSSPDGSQTWCNWIIRERASLAAVGYVQATVDRASRSADLAWVVGTRNQGRGYATEASSAMITWLGETGVATVTAHVHPGHVASAAVARSLGLVATAAIVDGEVRWERALDRRSAKAELH